MSRRHRAEKREIIPDPKFGDMVIAKFMNAVMKQGKKSVAENIVYGALERMENRAKQDPVQLFRQALDNVMPAVEVRSVRPEPLTLGGSSVQARHVTFAINGAAHEVWYDGEDRVLKVVVPGSGFTAERTSR